MSQGLGIYNTLLLPCGRSSLLQRRGRVFACRSSDLGSIPGWGSKIFSLYDIYKGNNANGSFLSFSIYCQTLFQVLSAGVLCTLWVAQGKRLTGAQ